MATRRKSSPLTNAKAEVAIRISRPKGMGLSARKTSAAMLAAIGVGLLALSVSHCTEAIGLLTGSGWFLSGLLAIGIDAGMVASEWAALTAHRSANEQEVARWSRLYVIATCALSVLLNCYAFSLHAPEGWVWASCILGTFVPTAVYTLGRVAGKQWLGD